MRMYVNCDEMRGDAKLKSIEMNATDNTFVTFSFQCKEANP